MSDKARKFTLRFSLLLFAAGALGWACIMGMRTDHALAADKTQSFPMTFHAAAVATATGTVNDCGGLAGVKVQITGITTATVTFKTTTRDSGTFVAVLAKNMSTGAEATTATADGLYWVPCTGDAQIECPITAWTSGTITVVGNGVAVGPSTLGGGAAASSAPTGAATSAKQDTGNTSLTSIDGKITAVNTGAVTISGALPAGSAVVGKFTTDQTTPGTTDLVTLNPPTVSDYVVVAPLATITRGSVATFTLDARAYKSFVITLYFGRGGTTALTTTMTIRVVPFFNNGTIPAMLSTFPLSNNSGTTAANGTTINADAAAGDTSIVVASATGYAAAQTIMISDAGLLRTEWAYVVAVSGTTLKLATPLRYAHTAAQADPVRNQATVATSSNGFAGSALIGGFKYLISVDYAGDTTGEPVTYQVLAGAITKG